MAEMDDPTFTMWLPARRGIDNKTGKEVWVNAPMGKGRPRARIIKPKGGPPFVSLYPDPETAKYEAVLAAVAVDVWLGRPAIPGALTAYIEVFVPIPASWSKRDRADAVSGALPAISKPDGDNYAKIVGDALNKIVWDDDSQIVMWQIFKCYSETPGIRVSVWPWETFRPKQEALI